MNGWRWLGLVAWLLCAGALASIDAYNFKDPAQEQRFHGLIEELRCPKCQNQNIADSNAPLSQDLRQRVFDMLQAGHSDAEIIDFMTARYGDFITYRPPLRPLTWILWFGPLAAMATAAILLGWWVRRRGRQPPAELTADEQARLRALLKDDDKET